MDTPVAECLITLRDGSGSPGRMRLWALASNEVGAVRPALLALASAVGAVTGCVVTGYTIVYRSFYLGGSPLSGALAARQLVLVFEAGPTAYAVVKVPGLLDTALGADGQVDPARPEIVALAATIAGGPWSNPFGDDISALVAAYEEFNP